MTRLLSSLAALTIALGATGCDPAPRALVTGEDACRYCRMTIDDVRFGGMVITSRGKIETFDSIECLASYVRSLPATESPRGVWVANFDAPSEWLHADSAVYLQHSRVASPMGRELAAFSSSVAPGSLQQQHGGDVRSWAQVREIVGAALSAPALDTTRLAH